MYDSCVIIYNRDRDLEDDCLNPITNHDEAAPRFSLLVGMQDADCAAEANEQNANGITGLY
jgi:hypothetical protein